MHPTMTLDQLRQTIEQWWTAEIPLAGSGNASSSQWWALELALKQLPAPAVAEVLLDWWETTGCLSAELPTTGSADQAPATSEETGLATAIKKRRALLEAWVRSAERQTLAGDSDEGDSDAGDSDAGDSDEGDTGEGDSGAGDTEGAVAAATQGKAATGALSTEILNRIEAAYRELLADAPERCLLLARLAWGDEAALRCFVRLLVADPPGHEEGLRHVLTPLLRRPNLPTEVLFPELLGAMSELGLATAILDFANYLYRERGVRPHPASPRLQPLAQLLADVTQQLLRIEAAPLSAGIPVDRISQVINDSVGLISALCDFLALHGDPTVAAKLFPCLEMRHRRVQTEAAYALAALGQEIGRDRLVALAAEPLVRRRVLAYAQPLGLTERIDADFQTAAALAESELVLYLAHPQNMGLAPKNTTLLDERRLSWPGYEQPVDCFLFQFEYPFSEHPYRNIGIVGPVTQTFSVDLSELASEDLYSVFAGWHVSHPEIYPLLAADFGPQQSGTVARLQRRLHDQQVESLEPELLGRCLDQWVLVARGRRGSDVGWAVASEHEPLWLPDDAGWVNLDATSIWYFWLGRTMLQQFNPGWGA